ncbi:MAG TPA: matrixin family metalloprotease [Pyrinomonadaceae bacterium]|nr:matrixin family metalloprotease [Pyrinomonadaceae bacterium]
MEKGLAKLVSGLLFGLMIFSLSALGFTLPVPADEAAKGARLRWKTGTVNIAFSTSLTKPSANIKDDSDVLAAARRSLATWEKVANIKFNEVSTDKLSVSPGGNAGDGVNLITIAATPENQLLFGSGSEALEISAKTRVFYNRRGVITEADIVLNPYVQFSTDGTPGSFDLEATITHEIGHLLGLEHSHVVGSTMQTHQGKNGIYNLPQIASRTLSDSDIAGARALYGAAKDDEESCCGALKGKITLSPAGVAAGNFHVWLEEAATGKIQAATMTQPDGTFYLEGLQPGKYRVLAQDSGERQKNRKKIYSGGELGEAVVDKGKVAVIEKQIALKERTFSPKYIGLNGQISNIPVPVNGGKSFEIYLGGENLNPNELIVSTNSPFIKVSRTATAAQDFGDEISVLRFEISVSPNAPPGEYSLRVQKNNGEIAYFIGGVISDIVVNSSNRPLFADFD